MNKTPILPLTSLRFFAAASIVFFHMQAPLLEMKTTPAFAIGVSFFFVLSGFILTYAHQGDTTWGKFALSRAARLWPVHLLTAFLWVALATKGNLSEANIGAAGIANLFLVQSWVPISAFVFSLNPVSWSISAEIFFYALFPFMRGKNVYVFFAVSLIIAIVTVIFLDSSLSPFPPGSGKDGQSIYPLHIALQFPLSRLAEFCIGVIAARRFIASPVATTTIHELLATAAIISFWLISFTLRDPMKSAGFHNTGDWVTQAGGMAVFAFAIFIFAHQRGAISNLLKSKPLVLLGEISFSTYMVHFLVLTAVTERRNAGYLSSFQAPLVYIAATYCLSYIVWRFVEKPAKNYVTRAATYATSLLTPAKP